MISKSPVTRPFRPLAGIRVIEFSQLVMGPTCGLILADLGADVIKVEPVEGDRSRFFQGSATGFFYNYCRNKRSLAIDTKTAHGQALVKKLVAGSDVVIENFRPGLLKRYGLDYETLAALQPALIYCSLKGYLPGPYENRLALDEVVQMMGGLAYMTGPPGQPMRAGASVNDIMGGMFGVIAIQAALAERATTGCGRYIQSALFENNVFLMGQMMMYESVTGKPAQTYAIKNSSWPVYDLFETSDGQKIFITIVGEEHWQAFCVHFGKDHWLADPSLGDKQGRVDNRHRIIPEIAAIVKTFTAAKITATLEQLDLPYAPVNSPSALFSDPHLAASGGLHDIAIAGDAHAKTPALPLSIDGQRLANRRDPPGIGEHSTEVLIELGLSRSEIEDLLLSGTIATAT